jgi:tetratricopeptide (TPR) repeat protein
VTNRNGLLVCLIVLELAAGLLFWSWRPARTIPPVPDLGNAEPALADHIRALADRCETPDDWTALGESYLAYGYFPEGEACYREAAMRAPDQPLRQYEWAFALERLGFLNEANGAYRKSIELGHSDCDGTWYFIGRNYLRMENVVEARRAFERAGQQPAARYERARLLVRAGQTDDAVAILDRLATEYPGAVDPPQLRHKIEVLRNGRDASLFADRAEWATTGAVQQYDSIRLPTPFDREWKRLEEAHQRIGSARKLAESPKLLAAGDWAAAEPLIEDVLRSDWTSAAADLRSEVEFQRGRPVEAARILEEAISRAGASAHLLIRLGDAYAEAGQRERAVSAWQRGTTLGSTVDVKNAYHRLATHFEHVGKKPEAHAFFGRAYLGAGQEELAAARFPNAQTALEKAVEYDPQLAPAWFYLGEVRRKRGLSEASRTAYERCLAVDPNCGRAIDSLALLPPQSGK